MASMGKSVAIAALVLGVSIGSAEAQSLFQHGWNDGAETAPVRAPTPALRLGSLKLTPDFGDIEDAAGLGAAGSDALESASPLNLSLRSTRNWLGGELELGLSGDYQPVKARWQIGLGKIHLNVPFDSFVPERGLKPRAAPAATPPPAR
ncbi:MAG: hypothetical protein FJX61_05925 [Alphaproteobacteria bacterium]|nr:hypothetical protein [Alphaproteobacteria bacterium]